MDMLSSRDHATFNNDHIMVQAIGLAVADRVSYYVSGVAGQEAGKAILASLFNNNRSSYVYATLWESYAYFKGDSPSRTIWQSLPNTNFKHFVCFSQSPDLIFVTRHDAAKWYREADDGERAPLRIEARAEVLRRFYLWMKANTKVPIVPEWTAEIWQQAIAQGDSTSNDKPITLLRAYGDCIAAYKINSGMDWLAFVSRLMREGKIQFPEKEAA